MPWPGYEIEQLQSATAEEDPREPSSSRSASEEGVEDDGQGVEEMEHDGADGGESRGAAETRSRKRRRITEGDGASGTAGNGSASQEQQLSVNGDGQVEAQEQSDGRVPFFKTGLPDPDDKTENDCFFEACVTRAGGNQYFVKHLMDKHGLVRGDQGRPEGGRRKAPKYLTLCPTDWPWIYGSTSSCACCGDINGLTAVLGEREHESPAICSFCWTYLPTRRDLVTHISEGPCKSNEMFTRKLSLIRHMYAESLRKPGAEEISRAAADQRQAHAEAERLARAERWQIDHQLQLQAEEHLRQIQAQQAQRHAQQAQQQTPAPAAQPSRTTATPGHAQPSPPPPSNQFTSQQFVPAQTPAAPMGGGTPFVPDPSPSAAVDYAVPSATAESLARSIERMSSIIGDLTAANTLLMQDVRVRDQKIAQHDLQIKAREERIVALACENKRLAAEVAKLKKEKEKEVDAAGGA
ncbi:hypothetical protein C8A03DRAFT_35747 [Achaetomium macrosporum]|uniref:Uncharacterized protein n=1 Tax=Achaetomium macrosporum TaxID=79813 RepID=A0AAN7HAI3_9PEZI|nr:hypothetical protein C8A03DRAFT_35747 [Achaetomium macrosporum]